MLISVVTEETRFYLFNAYEPFSFNSCCWLLKKTLIITTNLTNTESASDKDTKETKEKPKDF